jgi:preprotein translocase subunit SecG
MESNNNLSNQLFIFVIFFILIIFFINVFTYEERKVIIKNKPTEIPQQPSWFQRTVKYRI